MEFRPCIDIHNGKVKQIVGGSLKDAGSRAKENFVSEQDAAFYARFYRESGIRGGHIILLNKEGTEDYEETKRQALQALHEYPGGLQVGGGIRAENQPVNTNDRRNTEQAVGYTGQELYGHSGKQQRQIKNDKCFEAHTSGPYIANSKGKLKKRQ